MSVRDYAVLYLGANGRRTALTAGGGNTLLATAAHRLDGPEHTAALDATNLDATSSAHGLLPKLSGEVTDALRGDGTWGVAAGGMVPYFIAAGDTFTVPLYFQALYAIPIDLDGTLAINGILAEVD